jgi:hypothetical protein
MPVGSSQSKKYGRYISAKFAALTHSTKSSLDHLDSQQEQNQQYIDQFPMNDSFEMEVLFASAAVFEPLFTLYNNNPELTAERRCRIVNWLLEVPLTHVSIPK